VKIKLLIVDDHQVILDSLKLLFKTIENIEVVSTLNDSRNVLSFLDNQVVDIIISDLHMPYFSGIDLCLKLKNKHPKTKIILLTMAEDALHIREALRAGVHGYVLKKASKEELEKAIVQVMAGKKYYSDAVIEELASSPDDDLNNNKAENIEKLTGREIEILKLITMEYSTSEIAEKLFISVPTVESHRGNLMKKLQVKSAIGMVKYALKHGLVD
jgi:DNA-binding NarL/FixJ family response regulator